MGPKETSFERMREPMRQAAAEKKDSVKEPNIEIIEEQYDHLLKERDQLNKKLEQFEIRFYDTIFLEGYVSDETIQSINKEWLQEVRQSTTLLDGLDALGIQIFVDDLGHQQEFPDITTRFKSERVLQRQIQELEPTGGFYSPLEKTIDIAFDQPSLRDQVGFFLRNGKVDPITSIFIHEMFHAAHYQIHRPRSSVTEAQAYFSGILSENNFTLVDTATVLTSTDESSVYQLDEIEARKAVQSIVQLYALGKRDDEIRTLVAHSSLDEKTKDIQPLMNVVDRLKKKYGIDEIDMQALDDIYRLHTNNQLKKAQLSLFQTIDKHFSKAQLGEYKRDYIKTKLPILAEFDWNGQHFTIDDSPTQIAFSPADEKYPYDPAGDRSGIFFGLLPKSDGTLAPSIGEFRANGKKAKVTTAVNPTAEKEYLKQVEHYGRKIDSSSKKRALQIYLQVPELLTSDFAHEFFTALITQPEAKQIFIDDFVPTWKEYLQYVDNELISIFSRNDTPIGRNMPMVLSKDQSKIKQYQEVVKTIYNDLKIFEISLEDIDQDGALKEKLNDVEELLNSFEKKWATQDNESDPPASLLASH